MPNLYSMCFHENDQTLEGIVFGLGKHSASNLIRAQAESRGFDSGFWLCDLEPPFPHMWPWWNTPIRSHCENEECKFRQFNSKCSNLSQALYLSALQLCLL